VLGEGRTVHRVKRRVGEEPEKIRRTVLQCEAQDSGRERGDADRGEVPALAAMIRFGILQHVKQWGVARRECGREHAPNRSDEIVGRHGIAVGPTRRTAQVKCVRQPIGRNLPTFRHAWPRSEVDRIFGDEPFKERG
jgi:hypothetical protein